MPTATLSTTSASNTNTGSGSSSSSSSTPMAAELACVEAGLAKILQQQEMEYPEYMSLYTCIINYCTRQTSPASSMPLDKSSQANGAHFGGQGMYDGIHEFVKKFVADLRRDVEKYSDDALLSQFNVLWQRYTDAAKVIHHVANYLNRYLIRRMQDENRHDIFDINTLLFVVWRNILFEKVSEKLTNALIQAIQRDRQGESVDSTVIHGCINCYVLLGLNNAERQSVNLDVYKSQFEKKFLEATKNFYEQESKEFLRNNSLVDYIKKVEQRLEEEEARVNLFLNGSSRSTLIYLCEDVMLKSNLALFKEEFKVLLEREMESDLSRMFGLLSRLPNGLDPMRLIFAEHVRRVGLSIVDSVASSAEEDPKLYVEKLLEVHQKFYHFCSVCFKNESGFIAGLDRSCREIVNKNAVCEKTSIKSPELICKYVDSILKKKTKNPEPEEHEELLKNVMVVFKYIEDKDVFQKYYSRALAKRLVQGTSASDDSEIGMVTKLKEACGSDYTTKLSRMINDIQTSEELSRDFKRLMDTSNIGVDLDAKVLCSGAWPLSANTSPFTIPQALEQAVTKFQLYYQGKHSGRKLNWLFTLSKGEVKANYTSLKTGYTFQVSTYQMGVLLLYNNADSYSFAELGTHTQLTDEILSQVLASLCKAKVLVEDGDSGAASTRYALNFDFKSKKIKINLNVPLKTEQKTEDDETQRNILDDRKLLIQAAVVRIMKTRKQISHQQLMTETLTQLQSKYKPSVSDIKRCIDILIEKEYMERVEGHKDIYSYIA